MRTDGRLLRWRSERYRPADSSFGGGVVARHGTISVRTRGTVEGQGLAEYALILGLIAMVAIFALVFMGNSISTLLSTVGGSV